MSYRTTFNEKVIDALTALNAGYTFDMYAPQHAIEIGIYIVFSTPASAGAVVVETAHDKDFTGTWANLATVNWAAGNRVHYVGITDALRALRIRISSAITDGTIDAYAFIRE